MSSDPTVTVFKTVSWLLISLGIKLSVCHDLREYAWSGAFLPCHLTVCNTCLVAMLYSCWLPFLKGTCCLLKEFPPDGRIAISIPPLVSQLKCHLLRVSLTSLQSVPLQPSPHSKPFSIILSRFTIFVTLTTSCSYLFWFTYHLCFTHIECKHHKYKDLVCFVRNP